MFSELVINFIDWVIRLVVSLMINMVVLSVSVICRMWCFVLLVVLEWYL